MPQTDRQPLVLPAACFAAGIVVYGQLRPDSLVLLCCLMAVAALWALAAALAPRLIWPCGLAAVCVAGAFAAALCHAPPDPVLEAEPGEELLLSGCVVSPVRLRERQIGFVLELEPGAGMRVSVTVPEGEPVPALAYGSRVELAARVRQPRNFRNPGAFDYVDWLRQQRIYWLASARSPDLKVLPGKCGTAWRAHALQVQGAVSSRIRRLCGTGSPAARILPALLSGDGDTLDREDTATFRRTGTYHALVVSGLHVALLAGALLFLLRLAGLPATAALAVSVTAVWCYAAVAGLQPPVVRAATGFTLFAIARYFFRRGSVLNLLAATAILLLAVDPPLLYKPGFQLTFLAVASIGGIAAPLLERTFGYCRPALRTIAETSRDLRHPARSAQFRIEIRLLAETASLVFGLRQRWWLHSLRALLLAFFHAIELVLLSASIQLALLVPLAVYFHQLPLSGILANVMVVPSLSAALPLGLLAVAFDSETLARLASALADFAHRSAIFFESLEPGVRVPDPPAALAAAAFASTLLFSVLLVRRTRLRWVVPSGAAMLACAAFIAIRDSPDLPPSGVLELTAIDVGQGDSLLIVFPGGRTMLVDGGGTVALRGGATPGLDIGEDVVSPYLWRRGFRRIDVLAVTHFHYDHAGGVPALIRNFRPAEVWTAGEPPQGPLARDVAAAARETGSTLRPVGAGERRTMGSATLSVLSPPEGFRPSANPDNNDSLVLLLGWGRHRFLLPGDAEGGIEALLAAAGALPEIDVLKIGHHGSRTSTTEPLMEAARPLFALISVGGDNHYGHPHPSVIGRLNRYGTRVLRTDQHGLIRILSNGQRLQTELAGVRERSGPRILSAAVNP